MLAADLHQHLWPDPLLSALARREFPPRLRRRGDGWLLELPGEAASERRSVDHDPVSRALIAERDGVGVVGVPPSLDELGPSFLHAVRVANPARVLTAAPLAETA